MKFKVGDKVEFMEEYGSYKIGDVATVKSEMNAMHGGQLLQLVEGGGCYSSRVKLAKPKKSKNERIAELEQTVAELDNNLCHDLERIETLESQVAIIPSLVERISSLESAIKLSKITGVKPSIIVFDEMHEQSSTDETIEFEGNQYRKVDREAQVGDYVSVSFTNGECFKPNKIYGPVYKRPYGLNVKADSSTGRSEYEEALVYNKTYGRTPETVNVYELIEQPKSANQQRAEIIEKAKEFVEEHGEGFEFHTKGRMTVASSFRRLVMKGAECHPNDVFNENIGKAIALGRALGLDVSEFEQAVQPTIAVGQIIANDNWSYEVLTLKDNGKNLKATDDGTIANGGDLPNKDWYRIINDTHAIYETEGK